MGAADGNDIAVPFALLPDTAAVAPGGGLEDVGLRASLTYVSSEHLILRLFADVNRFTADTADSPIVLQRTQRFLGGGIAYHF